MKVLEKLGEGVSCEVNKCLINDQEFAIKQFRPCYSLKSRQKEIKILSSLNHNNIIPIIDFDPAYQWMVVPLLHKDLFLSVQQKRTLQLKTARQILLVLAETLDYLHKLSYVHRDIKLENVMLDSNYNLKLVDFGLTELCAPDKQYVRAIGTQYYMAPELWIKESKISAQELSKTDVFSLGVLLFIIVYGHPPFESAQKSCAYWNAILQGKWQVFWNSVDRKLKRSTEELRELLQGMLEPDVGKRFSIEGVLNSAFLNGEHDLEELKD